jgi:hypothetical protein
MAGRFTLADAMAIWLSGSTAKAIGEWTAKLESVAKDSS